MKDAKVKTTVIKANRHIGKSFDDYLKEKGDLYAVKIETQKRIIKMLRVENADLQHKADQYDSVVRELNVSDGGKFRADTLATVLRRVRENEALRARVSELERQVEGMRNCNNCNILLTTRYGCGTCKDYKTGNLRRWTPRPPATGKEG